MFLDDALEGRRIALPVPRALRIDNRDGASFTDAKAIGLRPQDAPLIGETELAEPLLQEVPCGDTAFHIAALGLRLLGAQEDVAARDRDADCFRDLEQRIGHHFLPSTGLRNGSDPGTVHGLIRPSSSDRLFSWQEYSISSPVVSVNVRSFVHGFV